MFVLLKRFASIAWLLCIFFVLSHKPLRKQRSSLISSREVFMTAMAMDMEAYSGKIQLFEKEKAKKNRVKT